MAQCVKATSGTGERGLGGLVHSVHLRIPSGRAYSLFLSLPLFCALLTGPQRQLRRTTPGLPESSRVWATWEGRLLIPAPPSARALLCS